ncbi:MAG: putative zinc-binding peptidase [Afipia birgiae]|jgi:hypothetical protein|nr:putative zinc-binding peptidase [Afipia birgiae]MDO9441981.1 putative zinc-binding peptidase [Beijerinckiaceae bacterium]
MKLFQCQICAQPLFFENTLCEKCGHRLGYEPNQQRLMALEAAPESDGGLWMEAGTHAGPSRWRLCINANDGVCNWMLPEGASESFCLSCRHNRVIPNLANPLNQERWRLLESAKHRLIYTLLALRLPLTKRPEDPEGLAFDLLEQAGPDGPPVMTGHDSGLITINLLEADDQEREKRRTEMGEAYRTLLGHVRHEVGHWYWEKVVRDGGRLDSFRAMFGDERDDYAQALQRHYANGPSPDWQMRFVSPYASSHPWEDFAETFAHYLHIVDTLETAHAFGLAVRPRIRDADDISAEMNFDPHRSRDVMQLIDAWLPLAFAVNSLNRSMGQPDLYPFILSSAAIEKLGFIHDLAHARDRMPAVA